MGAIPPVSLLDRVRDRIRVSHYGIRAEQAYGDWIRHFIIFHRKHQPSQLGAGEVAAFLAAGAFPSLDRRWVVNTLDR